MSIHERIREIRQALGLSQAEFAKDISISSGYVVGLELGNRPFRITFWSRPTACLPCKTAVRRKIARKTIKSHGLPSQTERSPWLLFESFSILPRHAGMLWPHNAVGLIGGRFQPV